MLVLVEGGGVCCVRGVASGSLCSEVGVACLRKKVSKISREAVEICCPIYIYQRSVGTLI